MTLAVTNLTAFLASHPAAIVAELAEIRGSSPREAGAFMLIAADATLGTIGGGALEYMVIDRARQALRDGVPSGAMDIPLGPEIGQCCGGRVTVSLCSMSRELAVRLQQRLAAEAEGRPHVFVFGAGHVGRALAAALALLPVQAHVVDTRPDALEDLPEGVQAMATALPEAVVRKAPQGSSFVILTHDHALDFLIAAEALKRPDAPYVGMVGSRSKRGRFASWYRGEGGSDAAIARLVLPIGGTTFPGGIGDKRPEVIAALAAAEILVQIAQEQGAERRRMRGRAMVSEVVHGG
ncbi:MAG TPA: xanthine dehydrogenase accessory protein XdhC [Devosiaceae bacterium]|jgi:xanthine dehydrogenase accessory factor|nr:xanthine dehydrogenase accessory protein XdhC [Devosiaceae bacterium]